MKWNLDSLLIWPFIMTWVQFPVAALCPPKMLEAAGSCFQHYTDTKGYNAAAASCVTNGGLLAGKSSSVDFLTFVNSQAAFKTFLNKALCYWAEFNVPRTGANKFFHDVKESFGLFAFLAKLTDTGRQGKCSEICFQSGQWKGNLRNCGDGRHYICYFDSIAPGPTTVQQMAGDISFSNTEGNCLKRKHCTLKKSLNQCSVNSECMIPSIGGGTEQTSVSSKSESIDQATEQTTAESPDTQSVDHRTEETTTEPLDTQSRLGYRTEQTTAETLGTTVDLVSKGPLRVQRRKRRRQYARQTVEITRKTQPGTVIEGPAVLETQTHAVTMCSRLCQAHGRCSVINYNTVSMSCRGFESVTNTTISTDTDWDVWATGFMYEK